MLRVVLWEADRWASAVDVGDHIQRGREPDGKLDRRSLLSPVASQGTRNTPGTVPRGVYRGPRQVPKRICPSPGRTCPCRHPRVSLVELRHLSRASFNQTVTALLLGTAAHSAAPGWSARTFLLFLGDARRLQSGRGEGSPLGCGLYLLLVKKVWQVKWLLQFGKDNKTKTLFSLLGCARNPRFAPWRRGAGSGHAVAESTGYRAPVPDGGCAWAGWAESRGRGGGAAAKGPPALTWVPPWKDQLASGSLHLDSPRHRPPRADRANR